MLLVYTVILVLFVGYASDEVVQKMNKMVLSHMADSSVALNGVPKDYVNKIIMLGIPSNCMTQTNHYVIMLAIAIWFVLAIFVICSLIVSNLTREQFRNILGHNAIVFVAVCCIELLFFTKIIMHYAPVTNTDVYNIMHKGFIEAL